MSGSKRMVGGTFATQAVFYGVAVIKLLFTTIHFLLFFVLSCLVWLFTVPFDRNRRLYHYSLSLWCRLYIRLMPFWRLRIEGKEHLPKGPCVLVPNHQSMVDILLLFTLFYPFKWVAKRELFSLPLFGWILHLGGYISIHRGDAGDARRMLSCCRDFLGKGVPVLLFAEGTRSRTGAVGRFKTGAFTLARDAQVPIVPIALEGSQGDIVRKGLAPRILRLSIRVLPPVAPLQPDKPVEGQAREVEAMVREAVEKIRENERQFT